MQDSAYLWLLGSALCTEAGTVITRFLAVSRRAIIAPFRLLIVIDRVVIESSTRVSDTNVVTDNTVAALQQLSTSKCHKLMDTFCSAVPMRVLLRRSET